MLSQKVGHGKKCSHRLSHHMCGGHMHELVFAHSSWAKCSAEQSTKSLVSVTEA